MNLEELIEVHEYFVEKADRIGVREHSLDGHTLAHLRELKSLRETVTHLREQNRLLQLRDDYVSACLV